jgi:hypothetical protein
MGNARGDPCRFVFIIILLIGSSNFGKKDGEFGSLTTYLQPTTQPQVWFGSVWLTLKTRVPPPGVGVK